MNKTYLTINYAHNGWQEQESFVRPSSLPTPTDRGAARMIASHINKRIGATVRPSDISVQSIEEACYAS